mmetsp:Transcript_10774/g.12426  ORF Transcript_10774/g.12426 Transcript_10774/m.12426 type:complete len:1230 (-) Transcript_10774:79-3768(-)
MGDSDLSRWQTSLHHYLPKTVVSFLKNKEADELQLPESHSFKCAVLFADLKGFTSLTEELTNIGNTESESQHLGTEELATQLNRYMTQIVRFTTKSGGDVLKFAGDAMVAVYEVLDDEDSALELNAEAAIASALKMQTRPEIANYTFQFDPQKNDKKLRKSDTQSTSGDKKVKKSRSSFKRNRKDQNEKIKRKINAEKEKKLKSDHFLLRVKFGISVGEVNIVHIGGAVDTFDSSRIEYLAVGPALKDAFDAEGCCNPGEVVVSAAAMNAVKKNASKYSFKSKGGNFYQVFSNGTPQVPQIAFRRISDKKALSRAMFNYVPAAVAPYLDESKHFESWLSELRRVTTLFCDIGMSDEMMVQLTAGDPEAQEKLHRIFEQIQTFVFKYEGVINKFLVDDKGNTLIIVFGLAPFSHDDDSDRAVLCGIDIINYLNTVDLTPAMGVTTGVCYSGVIGHSGSRREYSIIGDCINMAARLMSLAKKKNAGVPVASRQCLYIETETRKNLRNMKLIQSFVKAKEAVLLKGHKEPVEYYKRDLETMLVLKTFQRPSLRHCRLATVFVKDYGSKNDESINSARYLFYVHPGKTIGDIRDMVVGKVNSKQVEEEKDHWILLYHKVTPDESLTGGARYHNSQSINEFPKDMKILYFEFSRLEKPPKPRSLYGKEDQFYTKRLSIIEKPPNFEGEDSFSIIQRLKNFKKSSGDFLRIIFIEGSYGVGRTFAIDESGLGYHYYTNHSEHKCFHLRTNANPYLGINDPNRYAHVWINLINKILDDKLVEADIDVSDSKTVLKERTKHVLSAFKRSDKMYQGKVAPDSKRDEMQLHVLNDILRIACNETAFTIKKDSIIFGKKDIDTIFSKSDDNVLRARSKIIDPLEMQSILERSEKSQGSEVVMRLLLAIFVGLLPKKHHAYVVIDDSHYMDPYSWWVLLELAENWKNVPLSIILSHRKLGISDALSVAQETMEQNAEIAVSRIQDSYVFAEESTAGIFLRQTRLHARAGSKAQRKAPDTMKTMAYSSLDQHQDVICLISKLQTLDNTEFVEVRARPEYTSHIICNILEVEEPPQEIVSFIQEKTNGNPLFIADAIKLYEKTGAIKLDKYGGFTTAAINFDDDARGKFEAGKDLVPVTIESIVGMIIDKMSVTQQVALKVAALIPKEPPIFDLKLIMDLSPVKKSIEETEHAWEEILNSGIIVEVQDDPGNYKFMNPWVRESIQRRILSKQKEEIVKKFRNL